MTSRTSSRAAKDIPASLADACAFLDAWLPYKTNVMNVPSMSVAVVYKGQPVYARAFGYADLARKTKATPRHLYRIASHSKTFTAMLVAKLCAEGVLDLDVPISEYLGRKRAFETMTLRDVLAHKTGHARDFQEKKHWRLERPFPSPSDALRAFNRRSPVVAPGAAFKYSNLTYALAGLAVEAATGRSYGDLISTHILQPLALKDTYIDTPPKNRLLCAGHTFNKLGRYVRVNPRIDADGWACVTGYSSTALDTARAFDAFFVSDRVLPHALRDEFISAQMPAAKNRAYALGAAIETIGSHTLYGHSGAYPGFATRTLSCVQSGITVALFFNSIEVDDRPLCGGIFDVFKHYREGRDLTLLPYETDKYTIWDRSILLAGKEGTLLSCPLASSNPIEEATVYNRVSDDRFMPQNQSGYGSRGEVCTFPRQRKGPR